LIPSIVQLIVSLQSKQTNIVALYREKIMTLVRPMRGFALITLIAAVAGAAFAHHSFAVYDHTKTLNLKGTVTKWQWSNPHAYLDIDVKDASGALKHYTLEGTSINMLQRTGWRSNMIKAGDQVTAVAAPLLNGEPGGLLLQITLANGEKKELPVPAINTFKRTPE
jgi:Family of unknown function (DUF6152)